MSDSRTSKQPVCDRFVKPSFLRDEEVNRAILCASCGNDKNAHPIKREPRSAPSSNQSDSERDYKADLRLGEWQNIAMAYAEIVRRVAVNDPSFILQNWDCKYLDARIDMRTGNVRLSAGNTRTAVEPTSALEPDAVVTNDNQPHWTAIIETQPNVTLPVGTRLVRIEKAQAWELMAKGRGKIIAEQESTTVPPATGLERARDVVSDVARGLGGEARVGAILALNAITEAMVGTRASLPPSADDTARLEAYDLMCREEHESVPYWTGTKWAIPYLVSNAGGFGGGVGDQTFDSFRDAIDFARSTLTKSPSRFDGDLLPAGDPDTGGKPKLCGRHIGPGELCKLELRPYEGCPLHDRPAQGTGLGEGVDRA